MAPPTETQLEAMDIALYRATADWYGNYFSRASLISELETLGYSNQDSRYAVFAIDVDWRTRAFEHAEGYLASGNFSKVGLIAQLRADEYTVSESTSAANSVVANWVQEAVDQVSGGGGHMERLTRSRMITLLRAEGFTSSEATSAADEFSEGFWNYEATMMGYDIYYGSDSRPDTQTLIQLLVNYGFTQAQAEWGANNVW